MSATADKARYFLEQSVPELKELERKKLFSPQEITSIAKKRSDFEHTINARGSSSSDYVQYAEFEMNVDALRRKRVKRLGVKTTAHSGQRRIFFVFDRGTRKFPGDVGLWMQSIDYARKQKARKKLGQILTNVLRLHPAKPELWIYAASLAMEEDGDMTAARSYMQRGLRFCKNSRAIWLEYARLELAYMAKIHARRRILGVGGASGEVRQDTDDEDEDLLLLPKLTAEDINPDVGKNHEVDDIALQNLDNTPVMSGAIPIAIFDAAFSQFQYDPAFGYHFFELVSGLSDVPAFNKVLDHILSMLRSRAPSDWHTIACHIALPLRGRASNDPDLPGALRSSLQRMSEGLVETTGKTELAHWCKIWLEQQVKDGLDPALELVIASKIRSL